MTLRYPTFCDTGTFSFGVTLAIFLRSFPGAEQFAGLQRKDSRRDSVVDASSHGRAAKPRNTGHRRSLVDRDSSAGDPENPNRRKSTSPTPSAIIENNRTDESYVRKLHREMFARLDFEITQVGPR